jgi:two-component system sensor histidine kinase KdpD
MKTLIQPRAVLLAETPAGHEALRRALALVDIEGYAADGLDSARQRACRADTILVVIEAAGLDDAALASCLGAIRADAKSRDVAIAVFAGDRPASPFDKAGANVVEHAPVTPASALRMLLRLSKRARPASAGEPAPGGHDPIEVLRGVIAQRRARHKIFIGAAPGVGKTYAMLRDAHDRVSRGEDVAVGVVETHGRRETAAQIEGLELLPRRAIDYKGARLEEMDLDGILVRRPGLVLVDELAHTNAPGSLNRKRHEDVNVLLLAGIPVVSTVNIQHLESLNNLVERLTGVTVRETIPDAVLDEADEVVLVDLSAEALQQRLQSGKIYAPEKINQSLTNFFTTHNLTALRELVLRELADKVDGYLEGVRATLGRAHEATGIQDRLLACITPTQHAQKVIRRAARLADRLNGRLIVLHVEARPLSAHERQALERNVALAESLEAEVVHLRHPAPEEAIARYATNHHATIIVLGETRRTRWSAIFKQPIVDALLEKTTNIDVVIVATHGLEGGS